MNDYPFGFAQDRFSIAEGARRRLIGKLKLRILLFCWGKLRKRFLMPQIHPSERQKGTGWEVDKSDYIRTQEGQMNRLRHRRLNRICFTVAQQPKSKTSISLDEKKEFQQQVLEALQRFKRRAFRSPVIVELHFWCNQNNPPAIHTLAKNYLDLLSTPVQSSNIKRKSLLYSDDRLIKILTVNYHLASDIESDIFIRIDSFRNFIDDIRLVDRIINNDFEEYDSSYSSFDIDEIENDDTTSSSDWHGRLEDLNRDKEHIISGLGEDVYNTLKDFNIQDAQKDYLEIGRIPLSSLSFLFRPYFDKATQSGISEILESLSEQNRNMRISPPLALDLNHIPIEDGGTRIFKNNVVDILEDFKKRNRSGYS